MPSDKTTRCGKEGKESRVVYNQQHTKSHRTKLHLQPGSGRIRQKRNEANTELGKNGRGNGAAAEVRRQNEAVDGRSATKRSWPDRLRAQAPRGSSGLPMDGSSSWASFPWASSRITRRCCPETPIPRFSRHKRPGVETHSLAQGAWPDQRGRRAAGRKARHVVPPAVMRVSPHPIRTRRLSICRPWQAIRSVVALLEGRGGLTVGVSRLVRRGLNRQI